MPPGERAVSSKLVYKIKFKPDGSVERLKAQFVERGLDQDNHDSYFFSSSKLPTVRVLIALATLQGWPSHQLDINNAFLLEYLDEEIYSLPPKGYDKAPHA